jgi:hypothetical protein
MSNFYCLPGKAGGTLMVFSVNTRRSLRLGAEWQREEIELLMQEPR